MVPTPKKKMPVFVMLAGALAAAVLAPGALRLDLNFQDGRSHALLQLGFASVKLAFDFGHKCSNPNGCSGAIL